MWFTTSTLPHPKAGLAFLFLLLFSSCFVQKCSHNSPVRKAGCGEGVACWVFWLLEATRLRDPPLFPSATLLRAPTCRVYADGGRGAHEEASARAAKLLCFLPLQTPRGPTSASFTTTADTGCVGFPPPARPKFGFGAPRKVDRWA